MTKKRSLLFLLLLVTVILVCIFLMGQPKEEIVVYYTNDIHSYIDNHLDEEPGLSYSKVAALKNNTDHALLVDAGDHLQGAAYGGMDHGATIIQLMNTAGYDVATLGNHEFDYGMAGCLAAIEAADYPYVSCNFRHEANGVPGDLVLDRYVLRKVGGKTLAFVGITSPETISSSSPAYYQDEAGSYIYGIDGGTDGSALYAATQAAIDEATAAGADYVIALGHLGVDASSGPWTSRALIANTTGLDAFIDGHSHTVIETETVMDKDGHAVVLTQTGAYLDAVGKLTIGRDGSITTTLLTADALADLTPDAAVSDLENAWIAEVNYLTPVYEQLHKELLKRDVLHADETTLQELHEPGKKPQSDSYMWLYRTGSDTDKPIVMYEYQPGRGAKHPKEFLAGYRGYLHTDGYQGYHSLPEDITIVGCWAHARRKFDEAVKSLPKGKAKGGSASQGLTYCNLLFGIEQEIADLTAEERYNQRLEQAKPILDAMLAWANTRTVAPKSALGKAFTYLKEQWPYLTNYLKDGRLEISNNRAERSIKPFVIDRKNFLFANTPKGATGSAVMFSMIQTAIDNGLDPYKYLTWLLKQTKDADLTDAKVVQSLLPWNAPAECRNK